MEQFRMVGTGWKLGWVRWACSCSAFLLLFGMCILPAQAQSASAWSKRGQAAETREDYDAAFEAYRQAHLKNPKDFRYRTHFERMRYTAANLHVDRGRVLRQSGDVTGAINEFARALQIDPGNEAAAQELQITERPPAAAVTPSITGAIQNSVLPGQRLIPGVDEPSPRQKAVQDEIASLAAPVQLQPVSDDPITLHMVEDSKVIFQAIGKLAGLNVIFDPEYSSKRIPVDLTSVPLYDALRIVETLSGTFWKPVTTNTIFVAQNTRNKRTDLDDLAVQTFYLTNVSQQNDANEIMVAMRNLLDPTVKIYLVNSQNAIIVRATPDQLILAEKLVNDLDRTRSEVIVDVAVLEVSRDKLRNLGITLPTSFGLTPQTSNANSSTATSTTSTSTGTASTATTTSSLTLNTLGNLNATNFAVSVTGGTVNALLTDNDTRILQNPRIRASDGQRATLKVGSKIPVATGSYSSTLSTTASLGVQTQFTYLDVGVNIDMTPTVHFDREVSLKLKVEISSQNGSVTISGVTEPIIAQRVSEQTIQLKDGEPSILAGLLQKQDTKSINGTPGLGEIPFLKYFFSSQSKEQQSDEIVFLMIPHIVRESLITAENTRPIYTGTGSSVELIRRSPAEIARETGGLHTAAMNAQSSQTSAAQAANSMIGEIAAAGRPRDAAPQPTAPPVGVPAPNASSLPTVNLSVSPSSSQPAVGSTFQVAVVAANAHDLFEVPLQMRFDPRVLSLVNVDSGDLLARDGQPVALVHRDEGNGTVTVSASRPPQTPGVTGGGVICTLTFKALATGDSPLSLVRIGAKDSKGTSMPAVGTQGVVHVK
ncbi:MAG: cohesin domain-containing protein [Janthinobacterium lividum]